MSKYLKPAEGRTVDQPDGRQWPAEGMFAPNTQFVRRRIADGDLVEAKPPIEEAAVDSGQAESDPPGDENKTPRKPKGGN